MLLLVKDAYTKLQYKGEKFKSGYFQNWPLNSLDDMEILFLRKSGEYSEAETRTLSEKLFF